MERLRNNLQFKVDEYFWNSIVALIKNFERFQTKLFLPIIRSHANKSENADKEIL